MSTSEPACPDCGRDRYVVPAAVHIACRGGHHGRGCYVCEACEVAFDREDSEPCSGFPELCTHEPKCKSVL